MLLNGDKARHTPAVNKEFPAALFTNQEAEVDQVTILCQELKENAIAEKYFMSGSKNTVGPCSRNARHYHLYRGGVDRAEYVMHCNLGQNSYASCFPSEIFTHSANHQFMSPYV